MCLPGGVTACVGRERDETDFLERTKTTMKATHFIFLFSCVMLLAVSAVCLADAAMEAKIDDLISKLTFEEKIQMLSGDKTGFAGEGVERLGIPSLRMADGPVGVRIGEATMLPVSTNLAATWDVDLARQYGIVLAQETKAKGRHVILGPCICIHRMPLSGRNFESYGEDPYLTSRIAVPYIQGVQSQDIVATAKHYAVNDQEWERHNVDVLVDERAMREIHLPAFEASVKEAGVYAIMNSYNLVNGQHASENRHLLTEILKEEWGFEGLVMSDWGSVYSAVDAANNGLDLEMPNGLWFGDKLVEAVRAGQVSESVIDDKIRRQLRVRFKAGVFDNPTPAVNEAAVRDPRHQRFARKVAADSMVLLKNENTVLPLKKSAIHSIAVIGPNGNVARTGGGSSRVNPWKAVSPFDGIRQLAGAKVDVRFAVGTRTDLDGAKPIDGACLKTPDGKAGLLGHYYNQPSFDGTPVMARVDSQVDFQFGGGKPDERMNADNFAIRWTGQLIPRQSGTHLLGVSSDDGSFLYLDGKQIIDNGGDHGNQLKTCKVDLEAGKAYQIRVDFIEHGGDATIRLGWKEPDAVRVDRDLQEAVALAKASDVAIVCVGNNAALESEGGDVSSFKMDGKQDALVQAIAAANPRTIVFLNGGTPIYLGDWLDEVEGVIAGFYPGQEGGTALAGILFGNVNPSAKLPFSYIQKKSETYAFDGYMDPSLKMPYKEGVFVGYRYYDTNGIDPLFEFGYGLSYTTFQYSGLKVKKTGDMDYDVSVKVKNTGKAAGAEVVQLYVSPPKSKVERPVKELKGFDKVELKPGETKTVKMSLNARSFQYYDVDQKDWAADAGDYQILIGASSRDIKLKKTIRLKP